MRRIALTATVLSVVVLGADLGIALALDCHGRLVVIGASPWEVTERCGEPANVEYVTKYLPQQAYDHILQRYVQTLVPVQQSIWTYNFGSSRFLYYLTFQEGKLIDIKTGEYGR
jgi:Protein of unknown function (DUF2845)